MVGEEREKEEKEEERCPLSKTRTHHFSGGNNSAVSVALGVSGAGGFWWFEMIGIELWLVLRCGWY